MLAHLNYTMGVGGVDKQSWFSKLFFEQNGSWVIFLIDQTHHKSRDENKTFRACDKTQRRDRNFLDPSLILQSIVRMV